MRSPIGCELEGRTGDGVECLGLWHRELKQRCVTPTMHDLVDHKKRRRG